MNLDEKLKFKNGEYSYNLTIEKNGAAEIIESYNIKCSSFPSTKQESLTCVTKKNSNRKNNTTMNPNCFNIPARVVLYFLSWSGFLVSFMMRNDINFALVAMVRSTNSTHNSAGLNSSFNSDDSGEKWAEFDWDSTITSWILSSFYWMYVISQVVGGVATQYFGTKFVFGWSQLVTAIGSLCIPVAASTHWSLLILIRSIQGFASGLTWPAMYQVVAPWFPASERSRFMSSFQGFSFGIGLTYPLCGFIILDYGWRPVFYTTGTIGVLWCIMFYFLFFNTPQEHPRISPKELEYIELNVSSDIKENQGVKIPWKSIFTSLPAWAIGVTTFGRIWVHYVMIIQGPSFMKNILNFDIQYNGIISGLPFICSYFSSLFFCYLADVIVRYNILSLTNVRKLMTASSQIIPGLLVVVVGYLGREIVSVVLIWSIGVTMITAAYAGAMCGPVDLAANFAGPVLAFAQTIHMSASFLSPLVNGAILSDQKDLTQWQYCFLLSSFIAIVTYIMFQIYGTADTQAWNYPQGRKPDETEREILNQNARAKIQHDSMEEQDEK
ncbi:hypothetical protein PVAND_014017 [Polypedilum vanderplanki]|uniref:Major facilitator superfamily (MFS) profile domain-containing protein n=1 Tax=Polypedilum vanderplanki TaxID=319348 RepID=A0A9J6CSD9_POLVA|nr:hypothetical protein PVAND_014017 [Polypedilum vanderplanki]